jgi:hypothetical protein
MKANGREPQSCLNRVFNFTIGFSSLQMQLHGIDEHAHIYSRKLGLGFAVLQIKTKIVSCHTANSKPVKQEVIGTVILPPLVFPGLSIPKKLFG